MTPKGDSRRRTPEGEVTLVKPRDRSILVKLRDGKRLSQREAARALDPPISYGHYADIERGARQPSYDVAERIAKFYETTVDALFEQEPLEFGPPEVDQVEEPKPARRARPATARAS